MPFGDLYVCGEIIHKSKGIIFRKFRVVIILGKEAKEWNQSQLQGYEKCYISQLGGEHAGVLCMNMFYNGQIHALI